ncbi:uncharacterized protein K02A2.6-like [Wyeomyia smithii]|uniref:uncharacterized protein K02A2.6-like n=1 Tax=Wyeomyia smithii TaxID=174621 RepID=UPI0024680E7C|nr:uncharacterized protein K02A2.6-like [Wyeomyia smithii]
MKYIAGPANISDSLSRLCSQFDLPFDENAEHYLCAIGEGLTAITLEEIRLETVCDEILAGVVKALETGIWPSVLFQYQAFSTELGIPKGIVVREDRIVLPERLRLRTLDIAHRGHPGIVAMRMNLREKVWWPGMDRDIVNRIKECAGCAAVSKLTPPEPMQREGMPDRAWQEIAIDFFSAKECATFMVVVDYYSWFLRVIEMKSTTAEKTIDALEGIFIEQTYPETIRSDNGPPFSSEEFAQYCSNKNIRLIRTIPYWPQMNGLVDGLVGLRTLRIAKGLRTLRIAKATKSDWRKAITEYVYVYNTTPQPVTGKAPMELLTGRPVKDLLPSLRTDPSWNRDESVRENDAIKKKIKGKSMLTNVVMREIEVGDYVMIKNNECGKVEPKFRLEKFQVLKKNGSDTIVVNEDGVRFRRCISHLRKWPSTSAQLKTPEPSEPSASNNQEKREDTLVSQPSSKEFVTAEQSSPPDENPRERPRRMRKLPRRYDI